MIKKAVILFIIFSVFIMIPIIQAKAADKTPRHETEKFVFESGHFKVVGELRIPDGEGKYPLVIMVHGDGPARRTYFYALKKCFLRAGYGTLMWDKPGFGQSTGKFSQKHLRAERAEILLDAIRHAKSHPRIDSGRIGVWGISQAGIVIPMALPKTILSKFIMRRLSNSISNMPNRCMTIPCRENWDSSLPSGMRRTGNLTPLRMKVFSIPSLSSKRSPFPFSLSSEKKTPRSIPSKVWMLTKKH